MIEKIVENRIFAALNRAVTDGVLDAISPAVKISAPERREHGDWSVNAAMVAAKSMKQRPRDLAEKLLPYMQQIENVRQVEIAGPGFLNLFFADAFAGQTFLHFLDWWRNGARFEDIPAEKILVEFVSANPTGPLHVGHGRGAAVGDSVVRLLRRVGHRVTAEYYINDAGRQMEKLGESVRARILESQGVDIAFPEDGYHGDYIREIAAAFVAGPDFSGFMGHPETRQLATLRDFAGNMILGWIRDELARFNVTFDCWRSERDLHDSGAVGNFIEKLKQKGVLTQSEGAFWFATDRYGDEKPRVVVRENGEPTYFAADIAYHVEKFSRGFDRALDFWGADHHGYEPRVRAALRALEFDDARLEVHLIQFVTLLRDGETVSMGKRSGNFEILGDIVRDVGVDAARFFYLLRRPESHLEFDLALAKKQANDNPVFYVQYAHARVCSLRRLAAERKLEQGAFTPADLCDEADRDLLNVLLKYPRILAAAAQERAPHQVVFYLQEIAAAFHGYYNKQRILDAGTVSTVSARLALADAVGQVIADGLAVIGVSAPEKM